MRLNFCFVDNMQVMIDIVDRQTRSRMMSGIRGKNTKPELALRRALHARGLRYRIHSKKILGCPDIVFPKYRALVFVHGCFWHRHQNCRYATTPASRQEFWQAKFSANVRRDRTVRKALLLKGWRISIVWECALRKPDQVVTAAAAINDWLLSDNKLLEL